MAITVLGIAGPAAADTHDNGPVVVVGIPGLQWDDVDAERTPTLWRLAGDGASAALSVRTVRPRACSLDGWLTLGAGRRATAARPGPGDGTECPTLPATVPAADGGRSFPGWADLVAYNETFGYDPRLGLLRTSVEEAGGCVTGVGPGAAVALAGPDGRVPAAGARPASTPVDEQLLARCPLTVLDLGAIPEDIEETRRPPVVAPDADGSATPAPAEPGVGVAARREAVRAADNRLGDVLAALPRDAGLVVLGLADSGWRPHLHVALALRPAEPGAYERGWLTAASTRRDGMVQLTDATPSILAGAGVDPPPEAIGAVWEVAPGRPGDREQALTLLRDEDVKAQVVRDASPWFFNIVALLQIGLYLVAGLLVWAARHRARHLPRERLVATGLHEGSLLLGSVPVATFLANLVPWWRYERPLVALYATTVALAAALAAAALAGPWRRRAFGPSTVVATVTAVVLAADVATGSRLQMSSLLGHSPLIAGRFYGFGNVAFAVFAVAAVLATAGLVERSVRRGRRREAGLVVAAAGGLAVVVNGWPSLGSDFGGVLALVPAFALLGLRVTGVRLTWLRAGLVALAAVTVVGTIAVLDWLRPAGDRSHLGDFVQTVLDGGAVDVLARKIQTNLDSLTAGVLAGLVPFVFVGLAVLVFSPDRLSATALSEAYDRAPTLAAGLQAAVVAACIGFAVNDSGVVIPAVALTVGVPLAVAACAAPWWTGNAARAARAARASAPV